VQHTKTYALPVQQVRYRYLIELFNYRNKLSPVTVRYLPGNYPPYRYLKVRYKYLTYEADAHLNRSNFGKVLPHGTTQGPTAFHFLFCMVKKRVTEERDKNVENFVGDVNPSPKCFNNL